MPAPTLSAARKSKRVVASPTPSPSPEAEMDYDEQDAEGEDEDELEPEGSEMDVDELDDAPAPAIKIKFKIHPSASASASASASSSSRSKPRVVSVKGKGKRVAIADDSELDELQDDAETDESEFDEFRERAQLSPSKMTARQRSKQNKDSGETLVQLPNQAAGSRKQILTDAEKAQKKEETARRRKRQLDQKLEDEKAETINRLLRAQTGRARNKSDVGTPDVDAPADNTPSAQETVPTRLRMISSIKSGSFVMSVSAPVGIESALEVGTAEPVRPLIQEALCAIQGCGAKRKYRSTKRFDLGGCSMEHLRLVNETL